MDKPDTSYLFDAKMELHPEEESFAQPTIILKNKTGSRCSVVRVAGIVVVVGLIVAACISSDIWYEELSKCHKNGAISPTSTSMSAPSQI